MPEPTSSAQEAAQLWSMTCSHCHTLRPANQYAAEDWPVIVDHMRVRASLTKSEARTITQFLQQVARQGMSPP